MSLRRALFPCTLLCLQLGVLAGPLEEASITRIINDVRVIEPQNGAHTAALQEVIRGELGLKTGVKSRAELLFQDQTLTRLGAETFFSFKPGTRDLNLESGTMLLQVPKGLGGAKIRAASVTASITGTTIMMELLPGKDLKVVVLEGSLRMSITDRIGETLSLTAGKMIIMKPDSRTLPEPVDVDLRNLVKSSALVNPKSFGGTSKVAVAALPSTGLIEQEISKQDHAKAKRGLIPTNLVIAGSGTKITAATPEQLDALGSDGTGDSVVSQGSGSETLTHRLDRTEAVETGIKGRKGKVFVLPGVTSTMIAKHQKGDRSVLVTGGSGGGSPSSGDSGSGDSGSGNSGDGNSGDSGEGNNGDSGDGNNGNNGDGGDENDGSGGGGDESEDASPAHTPPSTITALSALSGSTTIKLGSASPKITDGTTQRSGAIYGGAAKDFSASEFIFGGTSAFDQRARFDSRFGMQNAGAIPPAGIAVYKFAALTLDAAPVVTTNAGAPTDLALIGVSKLDTGVGATIDASALRSLFLGTANGPLTLGNTVSISAPALSGFRYLQLYGRGPGGTIATDATFNFPSANLYLDAQSSITVGANSAITSANVALAGSQISVLGGTINSGNVSMLATGDLSLASGSLLRGTDITLSAGNLVTINRSALDLTAATSLEIAGKSVGLSSGAFAVPVAANASITAGDGGLDAAATDLSGVSIVSAGDVKLASLSAPTVQITNGKKLEISGNLAGGTISVGGDLKVDGALVPMQADTSATPHVITAAKMKIGGGLSFAGTPENAGVGPTAGGTIELHGGDIEFSGSGINGANLNGGDANPGGLPGWEGGNGGTLSVGTAARPITGTIKVLTPISATTGRHSNLKLVGGTGGTVRMFSKGQIEVGSAITVSDNMVAKRESKVGGNVELNSSSTSGVAIKIDNSGQLLSLLDTLGTGAGGSIKVTSAGGDIQVNGGKIVADKGSVDLRNNGNGVISLTNATLRGDVVRANAFGSNGQLIIDGGTIDATSLLKLYAGGSNGAVRFKSDTTLGGFGTKIIAGKTVTIDNGRRVTIGGILPASVYTDNGNYSFLNGGNNSTTGIFNGAGATTQKFKKAPAYGP